jgi:uncharacterized protein (TIGR02246 family)
VTGADIEARLARLEDRDELHDLVAAYGAAVDDRDLERVGDLFTADAVFESGADRSEEARGRAGVIDFFRRTLMPHGPTYHYGHGQVVTFDGPDSARGVVPAHAEMAMRGETYWIAMRYRYRYVREGGRWRVAERHPELLYVLPRRSLSTGLALRLRVQWPDAAPAEADLPAPHDAGH